MISHWHRSSNRRVQEEWEKAKYMEKSELEEEEIEGADELKLRWEELKLKLKAGLVDDQIE